MFQTDKMRESSKNGRTWTRDMSDYREPVVTEVFPDFVCTLPFLHPAIPVE
jgi:hypothetical protein